jgi:flagella synthesis protein FlgN
MNAAMDQLLLCVAQQTSIVQAFIQILEDEADKLLESVPNNMLIDITDRKNSYAAQLAGLDQRRAELLDALGFTPDQTGIEAACRAHPQLRGPSDELFALAHQAGELNRHNGQIIDTFLAHNQRALATLRSLMGEDLYDAKGRLS